MVGLVKRLWPVLALYVWLATPVLVIGSYPHGIGFMNYDPVTEAEARKAAWLYFAALLTAFVVPLVAAIVAGFQGRPAFAALFVAALLTSCAIGAVTQVITVDRTRDAKENLWPEPSPTWTRTPCQEYSGGDTSCPGG